MKWNFLLNEKKNSEYSQKIITLSHIFQKWSVKAAKRRNIMKDRVLLKSASDILKEWKSVSSRIKSNLVHALKHYTRNVQQKAYFCWARRFVKVKYLMDLAQSMQKKKVLAELHFYLWKFLFNTYRRHHNLASLGFKRKNLKDYFSKWRLKSQEFKGKISNSIIYSSQKLKEFMFHKLVKTFKYHQEKKRTDRLEKMASEFSDMRLQRKTLLALAESFISMSSLDDSNLKSLQQKRLKRWIHLWKSQLWYKRSFGLAKFNYILNIRKVFFHSWTQKRKTKRYIIHCHLHKLKTYLSHWIDRYCIQRSIKSKLIHLKFKFDLFNVFRKKLCFRCNIG